MMRSRYGRSLALAASLVAFSGGAASAQTLPAAAGIVEHYVTAIGGRAALQRFNSRHVVAEMSMPAMGMTMNMETFAARPNRMFTKLDMSGMSITSGFDGTVAWANSPMSGPKILDGVELRQALTNASFDNNMDFARVFTTMETIGERSVNGRACWNVRMVGAGGTEVENCFDKESGLLIGTRSKQQSQMGEMQVEATMEDYRDFDGVKMPGKVTMTMGPQQVITTIKSVSHEAIADSVFALPPEIRALQH